ncbi:MAG: DUF1801 domain-containing protein [Chloroflexi bacterium]|nr:DUF1801 domain-containing protein [Chloroflexota bacterium]
MPSKKSPPPSIEQFLGDYHPNIQELANVLRGLIKQAMPEIREAVYPGWRLIGYRVLLAGLGKKDVYVGYVAPLDTHVSLGFEWGVLMNDPEKILEGQGKQVRFVTIRALNDINYEKFMNLIIEGVRVARLSGAEKAQKLHLLISDRQFPDDL